MKDPRTSSLASLQTSRRRLIATLHRLRQIRPAKNLQRLADRGGGLRQFCLLSELRAEFQLDCIDAAALVAAVIADDEAAVEAVIFLVVGNARRDDGIAHRLEGAEEAL